MRVDKRLSIGGLGGGGETLLPACYQQPSGWRGLERGTVLPVTKIGLTFLWFFWKTIKKKKVLCPGSNEKWKVHIVTVDHLKMKEMGEEMRTWWLKKHSGEVTFDAIVLDCLTQAPSTVLLFNRTCYGFHFQATWKTWALQLSYLVHSLKSIYSTDTGPQISERTFRGGHRVHSPCFVMAQPSELKF